MHNDPHIARAFDRDLETIQALTMKMGGLVEVATLDAARALETRDVELAARIDADGVHVGQDDLPVPEVRRLVGPHKLIGLSTHDPDQAAAAVTAGADYIGVGPLFATQTKDDVCAPVGLGYLENAVATCPLPFVAIGGIKEHNLPSVLMRGAKTVCLVTEIVGATDITATARRLQNACLSR